MKYEVIATWDGGSQHVIVSSFRSEGAARYSMQLEVAAFNWNPPDHIEVKPLLTTGQEHPIS